jgi:hypothetical protein
LKITGYKFEKIIKVSLVFTGKEKLFNSNVQAANFLNISEWTIRKYKKSGAVFKNSFFSKKKQKDGVY